MPVKDLFTSIDIGSCNCANRIFMAPLTRARADRDHVPTSIMATYYAQRTGAGLIISEATFISPQAVGYPYAPGIYNDAQVEAWRRVTRAVHARGGRIFCQLWHVGRVSHPSYYDGALPVGPSAIASRHGQAATYAGRQPFVTPRALEIDELPGIVDQYRDAATRALGAGFDGVEIHAANGFLLDQFLRDGANRRNDAYGGSAKNRARLTLEVAEALIEIRGSKRVGIRISPSGTYNSMSDSNPQLTFTHLARALSPLDLAYLHVIEAWGGDLRHGAIPLPLSLLREAYTGVLVVNGGYDRARAQAVISAGNADAVAFGQAFIANPDLVQRLRHGAPLNPPDEETFYRGGEKGYIDYPVLYPEPAP